MENLLINLGRQLDEHLIPYMIIGGQGVLLYGRPRVTQDIDITLGLDVDQYPMLAGICQTLSLTNLSESPEKFLQETNVLPVLDERTHLRVEFIFSNSLYEREALQRVKKVHINDYFVKFASIEDLIIHKVFAGRAIDLEDVKSVLIKNQDQIDDAYIRKWLDDFAKLDEFHDLPDLYRQLQRDVL